MLTSEILYDEESKKLIMCESEYDDMKVFVSDFKVGAIGLLFCGRAPTPVVVKSVIYKSKDPDKYNKTNMMDSKSDYIIEFITNNDCYIVWLDEISMNDIIVPCYC